MKPAVRQAVARTFVEQKGWAGLGKKAGSSRWLLRVESWEEEIGAGTVRQGGAWREAGFILFTPPLVSSEFGKGVLPGRGFTSTISAGETWPSSFGKSGAGFGVGSWKEKNRSWALGKLRLHELDLFESLASWQEGPVQFRLRVSEAAATLARVESKSWLLCLELVPSLEQFLQKLSFGKRLVSAQPSFGKQGKFVLRLLPFGKCREEGKKIGAGSEVLVLWFPGILELGLLSWVLADSASREELGTEAQPDPLGAGAFGKQRFEGALSTLVELGTRVSAKWLRHGSPRAGS
ncbi:unnamed protein product [Prunus armeniaca]|uniref:Uncharacterized protein n=1 Tax=Prunus armeniaca TaxID=36596 RepID=A0A6J5XJN3_PRUAR|nr:unnamed protein product [Prunus armeniaca]